VNSEFRVQPPAGKGETPSEEAPAQERQFPRMLVLQTNPTASGGNPNNRVKMRRFSLFGVIGALLLIALPASANQISVVN